MFVYFPCHKICVVCCLCIYHVVLACVSNETRLKLILLRLLWHILRFSRVPYGVFVDLCIKCAMYRFLLHSPPRSGSTWLQAVLQSHPSVITRFQPLFSYAFKNAITEQSTPEEWLSFCDAVCKSTDPFLNMQSEFHTRDNHVPEQFAKQYDPTRHTHLVLKQVHHHQLIHTMMQLDPTLRAIFLVRDPRVTIHSMLQCSTEWNPSWNEENPDAWRSAVAKNVAPEHFYGFDAWKRTMDLFLQAERDFPGRVHFVQYEHLVDRDKTWHEMDRLLHFMNLPPSAAMMEHVSMSFRTKGCTNEHTVYRDPEQVRAKYSNAMNSRISQEIAHELQHTVYEQWMVE